MNASAGDPDVEKASLLLDCICIVERLPDRQGAFLEHRQVDRVPLEALCPMERRELDPIRAASAFGRGSPLALPAKRRPGGFAGRRPRVVEDPAPPVEGRRPPAGAV